MLQDSPTIDRRIAARVAVERAISVLTEAGTVPATTVNVSTSGVLVALGAELTIWSELMVELPGIGTRGARVARRDGETYGLVFREPLTAAEFADFAGTELPPLEEAPQAPLKPAGRTAPWAFGRDRLKTLKREAAERARTGR